MMNEFDTHQTFRGVKEEASHLIDQGYYEDALSKLKECLQLENDSAERAAILCELGYCLVRMGWYEDAVKVFTQYLEAAPSDNDARFYLASAYASMGWIDESIAELKKILASDPTDVLSYHALGLCYRDKGWRKEALEIMKTAKDRALTYGTQEEKAIIEQSLTDLEKDIEKGGEDKLREGILLAIFLEIMKKKRKKLT